MKRWVLGAVFGLSVFAILLAVADEKFNLNCSFRVDEGIASGAMSIFRGGYFGYVIEAHYVEWCEPLVFALMPFLPLLLLSLITYKMRDEVFRAWWRFARWWVPVIIAVTLFLNSAGGGGGMGISGAVSAGFDILVLSIFYAVFVIVSLVKIVRAYLKTKEI